MRISDWSADVCSSDRKPRRPARQRGGYFLLDIALPSFGIALAMHPDTDRDQDDRGEERTKAFSELARCPTDPYKIGCHKPGQPPCGKSRNPAAMDIAHHVGSPGFAKKGHHRRSEEHTSELQSLMRISYAVF